MSRQQRYLWILTLLVFSGVVFAESRASMNFSAKPPTADPRIENLLRQMTLAEKVSLLGGLGFDTRPLPRLGIPSIQMTDGPLGVRNGPSTAFPSGISMGASFNPDLVHRVAQAMADEARFKGKSMLLGPCVGISRHPFGGRNFEGLGEDPYLSSRIAADYIRGVQSRNVLASVKHFALNDQEFQRMTVDTYADLRAMFEIHFPAFKAAIDAGSWTVMTSYNMVQGHHATESDFLQNQVLKQMWNFQGFVVSDWDATHSTIEAANAGLDLEMPYGTYFDQQLVTAVQAGRVPESTIDDKVRRILRAMFAIGLMDPAAAPQVTPAQGPQSTQHQTLAREMAQESVVLLKNDGAVLPIDTKRIKSIAVLGPSARHLRAGAGGSSQVTPFHSVTPLDAIRAQVGPNVKINFVTGMNLPGDLDIILDSFLRPDVASKLNGLKGEYFDNRDLQGTPILTRVDPDIDFNFESLNDERFRENFSVRWTGILTPPNDGVYKLQTISDDGVRLFIDGQEVISHWTDHDDALDEATLNLIGGHSYAIRLDYYQGGQGSQISLGWQQPGTSNLLDAVKAAKNSDMAIIFSGQGNYGEGEGNDLENMDLPPGQSDLIKSVAAVNPNTVVVLHSGNPVAMSDWLGDVKGLVQAWYPGQEGGSAIADVLLGVVNPSGKLPVTFLKRWEDSPAYGTYPGTNGRVDYTEGIFVGYRGFDAHGIAPNFPFGFGLSYTTFVYDNLQIQAVDAHALSPKIQVSFRVKNTGTVAGKETPQVYVGEKSPSVPRPVRELKGFQRSRSSPAKQKRFRLILRPTRSLTLSPRV